MRKVYGKITTFPKKEAAFQRCCKGESFQEIAQNFKVAEATAEIYTIDMIAHGRGDSAMCDRILKEMEISEGQFARVVGRLTSPGVTVREIFDETDLQYNKIRAVIVALLQVILVQVIQENLRARSPANFPCVQLA